MDVVFRIHVTNGHILAESPCMFSFIVAPSQTCDDVFSCCRKVAINDSYNGLCLYIEDMWTTKVHAYIQGPSTRSTKI
jgi:hypothetical protein